MKIITGDYQLLGVRIQICYHLKQPWKISCLFHFNSLKCKIDVIEKKIVFTDNFFLSLFYLVYFYCTTTKQEVKRSNIPDWTSKIIWSDIKPVFKAFKPFPRIPKSLFGPNKILWDFEGKKKAQQRYLDTEGYETRAIASNDQSWNKILSFWNNLLQINYKHFFTA